MLEGRSLDDGIEKIYTRTTLVNCFGLHVRDVRVAFNLPPPRYTY